MNEIDNIFIHKNENEFYLTDGRKITYSRDASLLYIGLALFYEDNPLEDGRFTKEDDGQRIEIKDGVIFHKYYVDSFKQPDGQILNIDCSIISGLSKGCLAFINDKPAPDGIYRKSFSRHFYIVDGKVEAIRLKWF